MKYEWEIEDVQSGRRIWAGSNASNGECIIAYRRDRELPDGNGWAIVSLADGMVYTPFTSKEDLLPRLQGYRPLTVMEPFKQFTGEDLDWRGAHGASMRKRG